MWRIATQDDDAPVIAMSRELYREDPSPEPLPEENMPRTLEQLRREPVRGRAVVLAIDGQTQGYALLASFWSNELGGEICTIDELYIRPGFRSQGHARELVAALRTGSRLWPRGAVALALEVTPANLRALELYRRLGFRPVKNTSLRTSLSRSS